MQWRHKNKNDDDAVHEFSSPVAAIRHDSGVDSSVTCLSWDVIVSDTTSWRMEQGIEAALRLWPFLRDDKSSDGIGDSTWLRNKVQAVAPYLGGLECSRSVEYALLVRL